MKQVPKQALGSKVVQKCLCLGSHTSFLDGLLWSVTPIHLQTSMLKADSVDMWHFKLLHYSK